MAKRDTKNDRQFEPPLTLGQFLFQELSYAVADIRHKVVEEGWFGRAVTPHWSPLKLEKEDGIHGKSDDRGEPSGSIHGKASPEPDGGVHGKAASAPADLDGGVHGKPSIRPEPWMQETGGFEALGEGHKRSAERSYTAWSTVGNPDAARHFDLGDYVAFVQGKWAEDRSSQTPARSSHPEEPKGVGMSYAEMKADWGHRPDQPTPDRQPEKQPEPDHSIDR